MREPAGSMIINIGEKTTEFEVRSLGGLVYAKSIRMVGHDQGEVQAIVDASKSTLEHIPSELIEDLKVHGILMTGEGSLLKGIDKRIAEATGLPVHKESI